MVDLEIVARLQRGRLLLWYFVCTHCKPLIISRFEFFFFIKCVFRPKTSLITLLAPRRKSKWYINFMFLLSYKKGIHMAVQTRNSIYVPKNNTPLSWDFMLRQVYFFASNEMIFFVPKNVFYLKKRKYRNDHYYAIYIDKVSKKWPGLWMMT